MPAERMARASQVERRARALYVELARVTNGRPMQYRMVQPLVKAVGLNEAVAEAAIAYAVEQGWLITEVAEDEPPHSVCLTDAGRRVVTPTTRS